MQATLEDPKSKRGCRRSRRAGNSNDEFPNASLSVRDVHLLIRELEGYLKRIEGMSGREIGSDCRPSEVAVTFL